MVIHYLHIFRITIDPGEADSPLIVDSYTPLPATVTLQNFQTISRWYFQFIKKASCIKLFKFPPCCLLHILRQSADYIPGKDSSSFLVCKALDHVSKVAAPANNVKRYVLLQMQVILGGMGRLSKILAKIPSQVIGVGVFWAVFFEAAVSSIPLDCTDAAIQPHRLADQ